MASKIKVDTLETADGTGSITLNNPLASVNVGAHLTLKQDGGNDEIKSTGNVLYVKAPEYSFQNTSGSERMSIDSAGRVTMPYQPAFMAYHGGPDINYTSTINIDNVLFNDGNCYNTSNSTFTAPIAGRYLFTIQMNANYSSSYSGIPRAYWQINNSNIGNGIHLRGPDSTDQGLEQRSYTVLLKLSANDAVRINIQQNQWDLFGANSFSGYLIG